MSSEAKLRISWVVKLFSVLLLAYLAASSLQEILPPQFSHFVLPLGGFTGFGSVAMPTKLAAQLLLPEEQRDANWSWETAFYGGFSALFALIELALIVKRMHPSTAQYVVANPSWTEQVIGYGSGLGLVAVNMMLCIVHAKLAFRVGESDDYTAASRLREIKSEAKIALAESRLSKLRIRLEDAFFSLMLWAQNRAEDREVSRLEAAVRREKRRQNMREEAATIRNTSGHYYPFEGTTDADGWSRQDNENVIHISPIQQAKE